MPLFLQYTHTSVAVYDAEGSPYLVPFLESSQPIDQQRAADLELRLLQNGFHLSWTKHGQKPIEYHIDYVKSVQQQRSYPAPKQGAFNQAVGRKTKHVLDATGGWGGDAMLLCSQGYKVTVLERNPLMYALLAEAFARLAKSDWARANSVSIPAIIYADATTRFNFKQTPADCVYLDPMFPPKKKRSAAVNKYMQLLQWLLGHEVDASQLLVSALNAGYPRVAVKRPDYANPLVENPHTQFSSKLVHYDVYL